MKTRVLVVDDSALMRGLLSDIIDGAPDMQVVGTAPDAQSAREMIKSLNPDVLTLDVHMPRMDGLAFLERLMRLRPMPVVMVSSYTENGSDATLRALELGAVDFINKPRGDDGRTMDEYADALIEKVRAAAGASLHRPAMSSSGVPRELSGAGGDPLPAMRSDMLNRIIFVGASTGGTEAIKHFLMGMPADCPPIMIVQHMPESFTASFARRLDSLCAPRVLEAQGDERLEMGTVFIAPGHSHLEIKRIAGGYATRLLDTPPVNRHRPAVDVLFDSAAELVGRQAIGVILTGMGKDGAKGLLHMRQAGARTFGQDEASCVVYGMPREAFQIGAVEEQCSLGDMASRVMAVINR